MHLALTTPDVLTSHAMKGKRCCCRSVAQLLGALITKAMSLLSTSSCLRYAIKRAFKDLHSWSEQCMLTQHTVTLAYMMLQPMQITQSWGCVFVTCTSSSSSSNSSNVKFCLSSMPSTALPLEKLLTFQNMACCAVSHLSMTKWCYPMHMLLLSAGIGL